MNYLAHAYLSNGRTGIITGNMISDFVKGKKQFDLSPLIQKGIRLHRAIDIYTDSREATAFIKNFFRPRYRLYSGAIADVVYDHFLANDPSIFPGEPDIQPLANATYADLGFHLNELPDSFIPVFSSMKTHNWLVNYRHDWGIQRSLLGLSARSAGIGETETAFAVFMENKEEMRKAYEDFFPGLSEFSRKMLADLMDE